MLIVSKFSPIRHLCNLSRVKLKFNLTQKRFAHDRDFTTIVCLNYYDIVERPRNWFIERAQLCTREQSSDCAAPDVQASRRSSCLYISLNHNRNSETRIIEIRIVDR